MHALEVTAAGFAHASRSVGVAAGGRPTIEVRLTPKRELRGVVRTASGTPYPFAELQLFHPDGGREVAEADGSGEFVVEALAEGTWWVYCRTRTHGVHAPLEVRRGVPVEVVSTAGDGERGRRTTSTST
ncbi:MAG: hypothetical protein R3F62_06060 [Planctomycetota bacterium]